MSIRDPASKRLNEMMRDPKNDIDRMINTLDGLPTLPTVISRIMSLSEDSSSSASEITDVISHDQALTAKVLKLVNSSFYGFSGRIKTVRHAVVILGFNDVKNIALAASTFEAFSSKDVFKKLGDALWRHSAASAAISRMIAENLGLKDKNDYFVAGLLHDIGMVLLAYKMPDVVNEIMSQAADGIKDVRSIEETLLGTNHAVIGGRLAKKWQLPDSITEAIEFHYTPQSAREFPIPAAVVNLADSICQKKGLKWWNKSECAWNEAALQILKKIKPDFDEHYLGQLIEKVDGELEGIDELMNIIS